MKTRKLQVLMILTIAAVCVLAAVSFAETTAKYTAEQEGKHMFLARTKEDVNAIRSCLAPIYGLAKPPLTAVSTGISSIVPPAKMMPSLVQPDSTAIAASPRPEITTGSEKKK